MEESVNEVEGEVYESKCRGRNVNIALVVIRQIFNTCGIRKASIPDPSGIEYSCQKLLIFGLKWFSLVFVFVFNV